jgi:hypothetical protein
MTYTRGIAAFLLACLSFLPTALAHPRGPNAPYSVSVHDDHGRELPTFHHGGQTFVLGTYGERYNVRVENRTARRIEAVVSVDGRDVISGSVGDYVNQRGYVIAPYDQVTITGFRQSHHEVAAFRFTSPGNSYSARMGTPQNVGVIGVAVFPERAREAIARPQPRSAATTGRESASGAGARRGDAEAREAPSSLGSAARDGSSAYRDDARRAKGAPAPYPSTDNLGTEYGESLSSSVEEVAFRRAHATHPDALISLRYDDRAGLLARGIALEPKRPRPYRVPCGPDAFPHSRFAPPPPPYCHD